MTNLEKLFQVIGETFPGAVFDEDDFYGKFKKCDFMICPIDGECNPEKCPVEDFWEREYVLRDMEPEKIHTGYMVMVEDDGHFISYSGCIHPSYSNAMEELDNAEYHGWNAHIKSVEFMMKGGEWKNA